MEYTNIDEITLKYLSNVKNKQHKKKNTLKINEDDIQFYKHRINNLTYELLTNMELVNVYSELKKSFNIYVNSCINYFKLTDTHSIIQQDHSCFMDNILDNTNNEMDDNNDFEYTNNKPNRCVANSQSVQPELVKQLKITDMSNFIKRNRINKNQIPNIIIPKQKEVNIKTSDFRYKIDIPTVIEDIPSIDIVLPHTYFFIDE